MEKEKKGVLANFEGIAFVELPEKAYFGGEAREYLLSKAAKIAITDAVGLTDCVTAEDTAYSRADLDSAFERWQDNYLLKTAYPQYSDFGPMKRETKEKPKGDSWEDLNSMIGLTSVKSMINKVVRHHKEQKLFKEMGMPQDSTACHVLFTGAPGTAKTTVARLFAQILKDNGVLSVGGLVEVGRADLIAKYVGQTAPLVVKAFDRAQGSVLFIDEAYSLADDRDGLYGDEAIATIVQEMENRRDDVVVIFAGYPDKMEKFLSKNPGLRSRIAHKVHFDDYTAEELYGITEHLAAKKKLTVSEAVKPLLLPYYEKAARQAEFGNGRFARNILESALLTQADRLLDMPPEDITESVVKTLTAADFVLPELKDPYSRTRIGF
ncbi:MAG: AAA family ATPase [Christensenellaceae bacterium]|jgi:SpoVK/Ycf46/Vps4 family AAA+-type ATPase|nr:AAA family ATPase [Christensenellaceae bacterium]